VTQAASVWLVVLLAFFAANLPFVSERMFGVIQTRTRKSLPLRIFELVIGYFVAGGFGLFLEQREGQIAPQGWEFYAITGTLFITFAFPGFVYRFLFRRRADAGIRS
jgi:hypothetical protein